MRQHGELLPKCCWPTLQLIGCWLGGNVGFHAGELPRYFGETVPRRDLGYVASEGSMSLPLRDGTASGVLAIENALFEFVPEEEIEESSPTTLLCHQLEVGRRYGVILTNASGLYRYDIKDIVEVTGLHHSTPLIAFLRKSQNMLSITGEKLHLNHALMAMERLQQKIATRVRQFRFVPSLEEARYHIYLALAPEISENPDRALIPILLDQFLSEVNIEYRAKRASRRLHPPVVLCMDDNWEEAVRRRYAESHHRDVQFKWRAFSSEADHLDAAHIVTRLDPREG